MRQGLLEVEQQAFVLRCRQLLNHLHHRLCEPRGPLLPVLDLIPGAGDRLELLPLLQHGPAKLALSKIATRADSTKARRWTVEELRTAIVADRGVDHHCLASFRGFSLRGARFAHLQPSKHALAVDHLGEEERADLQPAVVLVEAEDDGAPLGALAVVDVVDALANPVVEPKRRRIQLRVVYDILPLVAASAVPPHLQDDEHHHPAQGQRPRVLREEGHEHAGGEPRALDPPTPPHQRDGLLRRRQLSGNNDERRALRCPGKLNPPLS
mmetsp:Transcript_21703/g.62364  ORF Transcript_21703/g.62364 Transcript_21703/m.62364 type:complete len:268 (-) Transcript_21703:716-1519(-)